MYPLAPGILILDVVQTRSLLDWSHTGAFDFSRLCLYQHWYWGKGGNSLNPIQASENIMILETNDCTSSVVAVRPVESHVYSFKHFLYQTFVFPNIRTDWWLWSYALHDFTSRWSSLKVGLQQSSWKVSQKLMKRVKHVVALRASLAMWENSELAHLNYSVRSVASGPSSSTQQCFPSTHFAWLHVTLVLFNVGLKHSSGNRIIPLLP